MSPEEITAVIKSVLAGKSGEFSRLVREFGLHTRSFIHSRVRSVPDAEDIAQETFIAAFRGLSKFRPDESFEAWLIGIARHRVQAHFRTVNRRQASHQRFREECLARVESEVHLLEEDCPPELVARLADCVERLPERMRIVVRAKLRSLNGEQVSELLKTSTGAVYMLQLRANALLRECMIRQTS